MTDIACPTCQKKYRLGDRFPAVFTCKSCGTAMDLSSFPGAVVAPQPAPAATPAAAGDAGAPAGASSRARAGARSASRSGARAGARRRGRARDEEEGDDEGGRRGRLPPKKSVSPALLWGSVGGLVVVVGVMIAVLSSKDKAEEPETVATGTSGMGEGPGLSVPSPASTTPAAAPSGSGDAAPAAGTPGEGSPGASATPAAPGTGPAPVEPPKEGPKWYAPNKAEIKPKDHHPDATPEERQKIDALIETAVFVNAGRDSTDAEKELVTIGLKAAPRIVNVFHRVKTSPEGFDTRLGLMKAAIADRMLRRMDGVIERRFSPKNTLIHASSDPKHAEKIARWWNWWWDVEEWKKAHAPWDERAEGKREDTEDAPKSPGDG
jgi:hypothetical protein